MKRHLVSRASSIRSPYSCPKLGVAAWTAGLKCPVTLFFASRRNRICAGDWHRDGWDLPYSNLDSAVVVVVSLLLVAMITREVPS